MGIDLKSIQPHKVSRDLSGYITYIYGAGGCGKTTFGASTPKPLLLAFERGYNALPGVMKQDVNTWGDMKQILRQLKDPEVKDMFKTIVIDTVDLASVCCEKYICQQNDIENIGDGGWGVNGWAKVKREWEQTFREVTMQGYAVVFISHSKDKTFKRKDGTEYTQIVPSCSTAYNEIIKNMSDIMGFIQIDNGERKMVIRSVDDTVDCKCRFKYIEPVIPFGYNELVDALNKAIDKESVFNNGEFVTEAREEVGSVQEYDYNELIEEFQNIVGALMTKDGNRFKPEIEVVVKKYLKGRKVAESTPDQAELIFLINQELKEKMQ